MRAEIKRSPVRSRRALLARARARRRQRGAVLFIVAVTLGLLAVMGVYGLTATSADVRASGNMREALQAQRAGEAAMMMTAETFNPSIAANLVSQSNLGPLSSQTCKTAALFTGNTSTRDAEACLKLDPARMTLIGGTGGTAWIASPPTVRPGFTAQSFGSVADQPYISVEVTNPIHSKVVAGNAQAFDFAQVTVTVFVQMKSAAGSAPDTQVVGRGRITVGPIAANAGAPANF